MANQSGEVIKMWCTNIYSNIIEYQKYIGTSIKEGCATRTRSLRPVSPELVTFPEFRMSLCTFILLGIRSVSDVLRAQSRFVKFVGDEAAGRTPYTFYKHTLGPKYVSNRSYNEFITPTIFI